MIPERDIVAWSQNFPWTKNAFIEQDMVICRTLVSIFSDPFLAERFAFRGGTAIHKLHFSPQARYSEDIDLVQVEPGPVKPAIERLGEVLGWLPRKSVEMRRFGFRMKFRYESEMQPVVPMRLKVEVNTYEHFSVMGYRSVPFSMRSPWFSGECLVKTYSLDELMGTKLRAMYQRKKGRDLFDMNYALPRIDPGAVISAWEQYMTARGGTLPTREQFVENMQAKLLLREYLEDVKPLLRKEIVFDPISAYAEVERTILSFLK